MDREELRRLGPALDAFLEEFRGCAAAPTRKLIAAYIRGLLGPLPRKSVRPMAREAGIPARTLQELLSLHKWDADLMLRIVRARAARIREGRGVMGVVGLKGCAKRGDKTPGVARQRSPTNGRVENCCVLVHLGAWDGVSACLAGSALHLPAAWVDDPGRRRRAGIPDEASYRSPGALALDLVRSAEDAGLRFSFITAGTELGSDPEFLCGMAGARKSFLAEVPGAFRSRDPEGTAEEMAKGASAVPFVPERVPDRAAPLRLLTVPPRFFVTNAPEEIAGPRLAELAGEARVASVQLDADARSVGLDHFEVRTYRSLLRHLTLSAATLLFRAELTKQTVCFVRD